MLVRIDDFPHGVVKENGYREGCKAVLDIFECNKINYVLGVVPLLIDKEKDIPFLKQFKYCTVAMHGYNHEFGKKKLDRLEFHGNTYQKVCKKIEESLEILKDFNIDIYIPPYNTFNQKTLDALNSYKFKLILGGPETLEKELFNLKFGDIKLAVSYDYKYGTSDDIVPYLYRFKKNDCIALHWTWEYFHIEKFRTNLEQICHRIKKVLKDE